MSRTIIEVRNLTKKFGKVVAVSDASFSVQEKECFALLGFNGAGKTTLINLLTTVLSPTSGTAIIDGNDLVREAQPIKRVINVSPQETAVAKNLTVRENLTLIANLYGLKDPKTEAERILTEFDLQEKADVLAKKLSGGQAKRLSIALAVITKPKILFLDEPTLGLDIKARQQLWKTIEVLKQQMTIILTTHYLEEVERLTDRIAVITRGNIKAVGTLAELLSATNEQTLEGAFLQLAEEEA